MCVLQVLPCQPSILERMKQPWRIWAVAADLSCRPEDPGCHGAAELRQLPQPLPAQNSPQAHSGLAAFTPVSPVKNTMVGLTKLLPSL